MEIILNLHIEKRILPGPDWVDGEPHGALWVPSLSKQQPSQAGHTGLPWQVQQPRPALITHLLLRYLLEQSSGVGPSYFPGPGNRVFETQYQVKTTPDLDPKKLTFLLSAPQWSDLCPMCFPVEVHSGQQLGWDLDFVFSRFLLI